MSEVARFNIRGLRQVRGRGFQSADRGFLGGNERHKLQRPVFVPVPVEREAFFVISHRAPGQVLPLPHPENLQVEEPGSGVFFGPLLNFFLCREPPRLGTARNCFCNSFGSNKVSVDGGPTFPVSGLVTV